MSKKRVYYRQCLVVKPTADGELHQTSWLPDEFAVAGKVLKLCDDDGWVDGWVVRRVGEDRLAEDDLPDPHSAIKAHLKQTGDSMPKLKGP